MEGGDGSGFRRKVGISTVKISGLLFQERAAVSRVTVRDESDSEVKTIYTLYTRFIYSVHTGQLECSPQRGLKSGFQGPGAGGSPGAAGSFQRPRDEALPRVSLKAERRPSPRRAKHITLAKRRENVRKKKKKKPISKE